MAQRNGSSRGLDQRVLDLGKHVQDIAHRFHAADEAAAEGPHASLSLQELKLVEYLGDRGPRMMRELATALHVAVNSITTTVDNLERKQVVVRRRSEEDRRVVHVE
ncbi:MAG TPA: MarR family transcriptional regulator, partial [Pirellulales bacterium]